MRFTCCPLFSRCLLVAFLITGVGSLILLNQYTQPTSHGQQVTTTDKKAAWPMFGGSKYRNMVSLSAKNVPTSWHVEDGKLKNIKYVVQVGSRAYGGPVIADGRIFVGTNNRNPRDPNVKGHKGVIMCFREKDGQFLWQVAHDMPPAAIVREALRDGMCSTPTVVGDRLYYVTPAAVVVCASVKDGKAHWSYDMMDKHKVAPNFLSNCAPLVVGDMIYVITGNGTDQFGKLLSSNAPSFLALSLDGKLKWQSSLPGKNIYEGQWSNPVYAKVNGTEQIIFPGGDSWLYSLEPKTGKLLWKFHCNPKKQEAINKKRGIPNYIVSTPVVHDNKLYVGVGLYPENSVGRKIGHFWCVDLVKATTLGKTNAGHDVSIKDDNTDPQAAVNKKSALAWHYGGLLNPRPKFGRSVHFGKTISTASVHDGLVYITEEIGYLHCLDAKTGKKYWEYDFRTGIWGSTLWADGRVYIGTDDGDMYIFAHGKQKKLVTEEPIYMEGAIQVAPVATTGHLYVMTKSKLYCIGAK